MISKNNLMYYSLSNLLYQTEIFYFQRIALTKSFKNIYVYTFKYIICVNKHILEIDG